MRCLEVVYEGYDAHPFLPGMGKVEVDEAFLPEYSAAATAIRLQTADATTDYEIYRGRRGSSQALTVVSNVEGAEDVSALVHIGNYDITDKAVLGAVVKAILARTYEAGIEENDGEAV